MLDGTPLLDIKPYVPDFDTQRSGEVKILRWMLLISSDLNVRHYTI